MEIPDGALPVSSVAITRGGGALRSITDSRLSGACFVGSAGGAFLAAVPRGRVSAGAGGARAGGAATPPGARAPPETPREPGLGRTVRARPGGGNGGRDPLDVARVEPHVQRAEVFVDAALPLGARDGHDVPALGQEPRQHELRGRAPLVLGDLLDTVHQLQVVEEVRVLKAGVLAAPVTFWEVAGALNPAREETAPERRVRDEADAELAARGERLLRFGAIEERVLALDRGQGVDGVGSTDGGRLRLAQPEGAHFAPLDQPRHPAHRVLDGHAPVHAVLEIDVDHLHAETLEARVAGLLDVLGPSIDEIAAPGGVLHLTELGDEHDLVAPAPDRPPQQLLVLAPAIHVGGVEEVDAPVQGVMDDGDGFRLVALAVHA